MWHKYEVMGKSNQAHQLKLLQKIRLMKNYEFCEDPHWIQPLEYLAETATRMAAFQVKPFVFEALFDSFLHCLGSAPGRIW